MCSRKGTPVASFTAPVPSSSRRTRICVSLVLRVTSELRMLTSECFAHGGNKDPVLIRRADCYAQAICKHRMRSMEIPDQHALCFEGPKCADCVRHANQEEICRRRIHRHAGQ